MSKQRVGVLIVIVIAMVLVLATSVSRGQGLPTQFRTRYLASLANRPSEKEEPHPDVVQYWHWSELLRSRQLAPEQASDLKRRIAQLAGSEEVEEVLAAEALASLATVAQDDVTYSSEFTRRSGRTTSLVESLARDPAACRDIQGERWADYLISYLVVDLRRGALERYLGREWQGTHQYVLLPAESMEPCPRSLAGRVSNGKSRGVVLTLRAEMVVLRNLPRSERIDRLLLYYPFEQSGWIARLHELHVDAEQFAPYPSVYEWYFHEIVQGTPIEAAFRKLAKERGLAVGDSPSATQRGKQP